MAVPVWASIQIAYRTRPVYAKLNSQLDRYQEVFEPLRRLAMYGIPVVLGIFAGVSVSSRWELTLTWLNRTPFGTTDPQFGFDVGFFVFELPFYRSIVGFASAVVLLSLLLVIATNYLYGSIRVSGREVVISKSARIQIAVMAGLYLLLQGISIWFDQYATVTENSTLMTGAGYTDVNAVIPGRQILAAIAVRRRHPLLHHRPRRTLAPAARRHRPAHRVEPHHRRPVPVDHPALPGRPERAVARGAVYRAQHRPHTCGIRGRRHRDHPVRGQDGRRARSAPLGRRDHGEHPPDGPAR